MDKDPKVTMQPNSGSLVIDISSGEKVEAYEGIYQCTAHNEHGTAMSNNIVVRQSSKEVHTYSSRVSMLGPLESLASTGSMG